MGTYPGRSRWSLSCLIVAAAVGAPGGAQDLPDLVTDRPDQTESAVVLPAGAFQGELGASFGHDERDGVTSEAFEIPGTLLRYGLSPRFELRLAWPGEIELEERGEGLRRSLRGAADPELGFKASMLSTDRGDGFDLALLVHTTLPVGSEEIGSPRSDPSLRLLVAHELSERVALGWNVGLESSSLEDDARVRHTLSRFVYTGSLGISLAERWGTFVELYGDLPASDSAPAAHSFDAGVTFLATPALQLDFAAGVGLNEAAPDWFVGVGLSYRRLRRPPNG
jgi:hypothetical protein